MARREYPVLGWLAAGAVAALGLLVWTMASQGRTTLDIVTYAMIALLFAAQVPFILYLLFEIHRRHRMQAVFDGKRLAETVRKTLRLELESLEQERLLRESNFVLLVPMNQRGPESMGDVPALERPSDERLA
jgi:hypothetical protein